MSSIILPVAELFAHRPATISKMLQPLRGKPVPCQLHARMVLGGKIVAAHEGKTAPESHYDEWRFRTRVKDLESQYFELWKVSPDEQSACLERAYFHLFQIDRRARRVEQLICIHCDPNDTDADLDLRTYKRGLHLHVNRAAPPLPRCHFPLVVSHLRDHVDDLLSSIDHLTLAFGAALRAVDKEVISRYI